jgi:hypothetical protein
MKRDGLRNQNIEIKIEPGLADTATIQNPRTDSFSSFKTTTKGTNMLAEISQPRLGVAELRNFGRLLGISETLSPDIRDQILRKAFDEEWTLEEFKKKAASMTSHEEFRKRKDKQNDKIITKQALEIKELKKENKEVKKTINVIKKQVAKQDLKIEVVNEKVVENTQQIVTVSGELGVVSTKVDGNEVNIGRISDYMNILVEQNIASSKNADENLTKLSKIVKKVVKNKKKSAAQNDSDHKTVTFSNDEHKRRKYSESNSTSVNRNASPERRVETPDNSRSRAMRYSPVRKSVRRENGDDRKSTRSSLPRNRSPRNRPLRSRSPTVHSGHNRSTRSRSPSRSNRKTSSQKNYESMNSYDFNLNYDVASRKEKSKIREKRSSSNWQSLSEEKEVSSHQISKSRDEVVTNDVISDSHSNFPSGDELDNANSNTPEKQVWHDEANSILY